VANSRYEIDPALPRSQQMIELTATLGGDVQWFVNEQLQTAQSDGRVFWQLQPGEWKLRAVSGRTAAEETVTVE
jgi:hypothetical protein